MVPAGGSARGSVPCYSPALGIAAFFGFPGLVAASLYSGSTSHAFPLCVSTSSLCLSLVEREHLDTEGSQHEEDTGRDLCEHSEAEGGHLQAEEVRVVGESRRVP